MVTKRGLSVQPSRASRIAGWNRAAQGSLPPFLCASAIARSAPGTPTLRPPGIAALWLSGDPAGV